MSSPRIASKQRKTAETDINVSINLDGTGKSDISTGLGFYNHMLEAFARHGRFDLEIQATGDLEVDTHHTIEDVAIVLGQAIDSALGDRDGIVRMGDATVPLDEALIQSVVDISGRSHAEVNFSFGPDAIGEVPAEMIPHVFHSLANGARLTVHIRQLSGVNNHHIAEAAMKALGRSLDMATTADPRITGSVPSTKETLTN
jgi:imidazoleglycerol-phosphate dehydratase